jgi:outer membrane protein assembly factor BamA
MGGFDFWMVKVKSKLESASKIRLLWQPQAKLAHLCSMFNFNAPFKRFVLRLFAVFLLIAGFFGESRGQGTLKLSINPADQVIFWAKMQSFSPAPRQSEPGIATFQLTSKTNVDSVCRSLLKHFRNRAHLAISIDSLQNQGDTLFEGQCWLGPSMKWLNLRINNPQAQLWAQALRYNPLLFNQKTFYFEDLISLQKRMLQHAENNGFPFAQIWLDSIELQSNGFVSATLMAVSERFVPFAGIRTHGNVRLPRHYFSNYLGLKTGSPYSRARVLRIREQLQSLLFLESTANPIIGFSNEGAMVNLFLQKKRASRFDFVVGILPQPENASRSVLLTGTLSAAFLNALNQGERLSVELERLRPETQKLELQAAVPYLLGSVFGVDGRLGIFKRDSTWVDAQSDLGVQYMLPEASFFRIFWENKSATLQKIDTAALWLSRKLPANLDFKQTGFGLEGSFTRLDYRFNPRKGWLLNVKAVAGFNKVVRNNQIESLRDSSFEFSALYDSLDSRSTRFRVEGLGAVYLPLFKRSTFKLGFRLGRIFSSQPVFANEQYRLGGNKLLRGFNEESLQATNFLVTTGEWRLLIGQNSFLAAFADWAYLENLTDRNRAFLRPLGFGGGLNFETKAGIFGINVAVGRRDPGQAINFRAAKFHLGYVSLF